MSSADILVVILGVALAIFLVLGIILTVYLVIIAQKIKKVTESAEEVTRNFSNVVSMLQKAVAPAVITKVVGDIAVRVSDHFGKSKKEEDK